MRDRHACNAQANPVPLPCSPQTKNAGPPQPHRIRAFGTPDTTSRRMTGRGGIAAARLAHNFRKHAQTPSPHAGSSACARRGKAAALGSPRRARQQRTRRKSTTASASQACSCADEGIVATGPRLRCAIERSGGLTEAETRDCRAAHPIAAFTHKKRYGGKRRAGDAGTRCERRAPAAARGPTTAQRDSVPRGKWKIGDVGTQACARAVLVQSPPALQPPCSEQQASICEPSCRDQVCDHDPGARTARHPLRNFLPPSMSTARCKTQSVLLTKAEDADVQADIFIGAAMRTAACTGCGCG
eukprot:349906-Chlamydomonas_euryale.AAC.6